MSDKDLNPRHYYYNKVGKPLKRLAFALFVLMAVTLAGIGWLAFTTHR